MLTKEFINPSPMGFSNSVAYTSNGVRTILISGQVGYDGTEIPEGIGAQAEIAFANLAKELKAAGADVGDVIKINTYIVGMDRERSTAVGHVKAKYFTQENQPAATWVGVASLIFPSLLVEIEATAVVEA
ncbi:MAG: RidA family protein [Candidatus Hydrogenedentes bacterium]|nr:RidA family protein [Candidatus Hydrogenedentota bacterium]